MRINEMKQKELLEWIQKQNFAETAKPYWTKSQLLSFIKEQKKNAKGAKDVKPQAQAKPQADVSPVIAPTARAVTELDVRIDNLQPLQKLTLVSIAFAKYGDLLQKGNIGQIVQDVNSYEFQMQVHHLKEAINAPQGRLKYEALLVGVEQLGGNSPAFVPQGQQPTADVYGTPSAEELKRRRDEDRALAEQVSLKNTEHLWDMYTRNWAEGNGMEESDAKDIGKNAKPWKRTEL